MNPVAADYLRRPLSIEPDPQQHTGRQHDDHERASLDSVDGGVVQAQVLILAGSAAGIAAAFNTPLAGIVFAIEEMSRNFEIRANGAIPPAVILSGLAARRRRGGADGAALRISVARMPRPVAAGLTICSVYEIRRRNP